jgi:hypothetical protein
LYFFSQSIVYSQIIENLDCELLPVVTFQSELGLTYGIEVSREGSDVFQPLTTLEGTGEEIVYVDQERRSQKCFYRVTRSGAIAPRSMDGVTIQITQNQGPTLELTAARGQDPSQSNDIEVGTFEYRVSGQQGFILNELIPNEQIVDLDYAFGDDIAAFRKWPDRIISGNYRYRPLGGNSGRLEFFGNLYGLDKVVSRRIDFDSGFSFQVARLFWDDPTAGNPLIFDFSFDAGNSGSIINTEGVLTTPSNQVPAISELEIPLSINVSLTEGGRVPAGYTSDYQGEDQIFDGALADLPLTLVDDYDGSKLIFSLIDENLNSEPNVRESGTFTMIFDPQGEPTTTNVTTTGTYQLKTIEGTDLFEFILDYNEESAPDLFASGAVQDGIVLLDFRTGAYSRPSSEGSEIGWFTRD